MTYNVALIKSEPHTILVFSSFLQAFLVDIFGRKPVGRRSSSDMAAGGADGGKTAAEEPAEHIGSCYLMPQNFKGTEGRIQVGCVDRSYNLLHVSICPTPSAN